MSSRSHIKIAPNAVVCQQAELKGEIYIGANTVIHPRAFVMAKAGPIYIGENNIIEEQAYIHNSFSSDDEKKKKDKDKPEPIPMHIGNYNVFEVGCRIESKQIGDSNTIEAKAVIGRDTKITNNCIIGAHCKLSANETIPENTIIFGDECHQKPHNELPIKQDDQLGFLIKILPNYHNLKKSSKKKGSKDP